MNGPSRVKLSMQIAMRSFLACFLWNIVLLGSACAQSVPSNAAQGSRPRETAREQACSTASNPEECNASVDNYFDRAVDASVQQITTAPIDPLHSADVSEVANSRPQPAAKVSVTSWAPQRTTVWSPVAPARVAARDAEASLAPSFEGAKGADASHEIPETAAADNSAPPEVDTVSLHRKLSRIRTRKLEDEKRSLQRAVQKQQHEDCRRQHLSAPECRLKLITDKVSPTRAGAETFPTSHQRAKR